MIYRSSTSIFMIVALILAALASFGGMDAPLTLAVGLARPKVSFKKGPDLIAVTTTYNGTDVWGARYYFTLSLPENAGEALGQVTINQRQGFEDIEFKLKDTQAFIGTPRNQGEKLTLKDVAQDTQTPTILVTFDPPVQPGATVTLELRPIRNPSVGGVYIFGVTAFPAVENPYGLYLGIGRLHFYENRPNLWFR